MHTDLVIRIKNAQAAGKEIVKVPCSKMAKEILEIFSKNGFVAGFEKKGKGARKFFEVSLKGGKTDGLSGVKIISRPSRKIYVGYRDLRPVKNNFGLAVLSTPKGIMTNREARKQKVGGEYLFEIW